MTRPIKFGTDGVRGRFGEWPITTAGAEQIGIGIATWTKGGRVMIGRDTRESGPQLLEALTRGLSRGGSTTIDLGILPTAGVSCAVEAGSDIAAGVMITASHNPWQDNGIKVVEASGEKLIDTTALADCFTAPVQRDGGQSEVHPQPPVSYTHLTLPTKA